MERFQEPALGREVGRDRMKRISVPREHGEGSAVRVKTSQEGQGDT